MYAQGTDLSQLPYTDTMQPNLGYRPRMGQAQSIPPQRMGYGSGGLAIQGVQPLLPNPYQPYANNQGQQFTGTMSFAPGTSDQYRHGAYGNWAQQQGYGPQVMGYGTDSFGNTIRNVLGYQGLSVQADYGSQNPSVEYAPGFGQPGYMGPGYGSPGYMGQAGPEVNTGYMPPTRKGEMYNPNPPGSPEWWAYKYQQDAATMASRPRQWGPADYAKRDQGIAAKNAIPSAAQPARPVAYQRQDPQAAAHKAAYGQDGSSPFNEGAARGAYYAANRANVQNYYGSPQGKKDWKGLDGAWKAMHRAYGSA